MRLNSFFPVLIVLPLLMSLSACTGMNIKKANEHYKQGHALIVSGDYDQAVKQMERAQALGMKSMAFYYNLGVSYSYQKEGFRKSEAAYMKALEYTDETEEKKRKYYLPYTHYNLASLYALENRSEEAFSHLFHAVNAGFNSYHLIATDSELDSLRAHPYFEQLKSSIQNKEPLPPPPHLPPIPAPPQQPPVPPSPPPG